MRKFLGMVIMTEKEYAEELQAMKKRGEESGFREGIKAAQKGLDDETRQFMRTLGFLNVTDDFWKDRGLITFIGDGLNWAIPTPHMKQKYMPFHEWQFYGKTRREIRHMAMTARDYDY